MIVKLPWGRKGEMLLGRRKKDKDQGLLDTSTPGGMLLALIQGGEASERAADHDNALRIVSGQGEIHWLGNKTKTINNVES